MKTVQKIVDNTLILPEELHELNNKYVIINVGGKNPYILKIEICNLIERGDKKEEESKGKSKEEIINYIIENYPQKTPSEIGKALGKSDRQINQIIYVLRKKGIITGYSRVRTTPSEKDIMEAISATNITELRELADKIPPKKVGRKAKFTPYMLLRCAILAKILNITYNQISMLIHDNKKIRELLGIPDFEHMYSILRGLQRLPINKYESELEEILKKINGSNNIRKIEETKERAINLWIDSYMPYKLISEKLNVDENTVREWIDEYLKENINSMPSNKKMRLLRRKVLEKHGKVQDIIREINREFGTGLSIRTVIRWIRQYEKLRAELYNDELRKKTHPEIIEYLKQKYKWNVLHEWEMKDEMLRIKWEKWEKDKGERYV